MHKIINAISRLLFASALGMQIDSHFMSGLTLEKTSIVLILVALAGMLHLCLPD